MPVAAPLCRERLRELLGPSWVRELVLVDRVGSTNDLARELAAAGAPHGTVVLAESQSAGRGRHGRHWHSPPGLGLYVSVLLRRAGPPADTTRWTLAAALALCEAARALARCPIAIDWPNDLVWQGRKLGGVLGEASGGIGATELLVLGAGLNVLHREGDFPAELAGCATSLALACGRDGLERELAAASYLTELGRLAERLDRGDAHALAERWEELASSRRGQLVRVREDGARARCFVGRTAGIDSRGSLLVQEAGGALHAVVLSGSVEALEG
jgi:BirA family biotin operon repressor/biotin-[acetyl-CoA-carboxylase] ligase